MGEWDETVYQNMKANKRRFGNPPDSVIVQALEYTGHHGGHARGLLEDFRRLHNWKPQWEEFTVQVVPNHSFHGI